MKIRKSFGHWIPAFAFAVVVGLGGMPALAQSTAGGQIDVRKLAISDHEKGNWFWGMLNDPDLMTGATAVAADARTPSVFYVGGPGYIAVSSDSGVNWQITHRFDAIEVSEEDLDNGSDSAKAPTNERADRIREYLRNALEENYDSSFVESRLELVSDEELLNAETIEDIDALEGLEIEGETDLSQIQFEGEGSPVIALPELGSFIQRYTTLTAAGAEAESAIRGASSSSVVWQFTTTPQAVYAVSSDAIYYSTNQGLTWETFFSSATSESKILSFDISSDGTVVAIGMTDTVMLTRNAGVDWVYLDTVIDGASFKIDVPERVEDPILVLTTEDLYASYDLGLTWRTLDIVQAMYERVLDIMPIQNHLYVLTDQALYDSANGRIWNHIPLGPLSSESVLQVVMTPSKPGQLVARTEQRIYEYNGGWKLQDTSLMTASTGPLILLNDGESLALMATPSGVWIAQDRAKIEITPEYQELFDTWAKEPSDDWVIDRALEAHYLDEWIDIRWGLRSRMAWLAPTVKLNYFMRQIFTHDVKAVSNMRFGVLESERYRYDAKEIHQFEVRASWKFEIDKSFRHDVIHAGLIRNMQIKRNALIKLVQSMLKKRRAYQTTLAVKFPRTSAKKSKSVQDKYIKNWLGLQEIDANLNYLTGGAFIPAIQESHKNY